MVINYTIAYKDMRAIHNTIIWNSSHQNAFTLLGCTLISVILNNRKYFIHVLQNH